MNMLVKKTDKIVINFENSNPTMKGPTNKIVLKIIILTKNIGDTGVLSTGGAYHSR